MVYNLGKGTSIPEESTISSGSMRLLIVIGVLLPFTLFIIKPHNSNSHNSKY